jgi:6,7-dimethyl-8-ribityllumazine synthase
MSRFNLKITSAMLREAIRLAEMKGAKVQKVVEVPGAYEIPFAAAALLARRDIDAVATVGAVIKGGTKHDEAIMPAVCLSLSSLSLKYEKPVGLGVIGPGATESAAKARVKDYARRAIDAALYMARLEI